MSTDETERKPREHGERRAHASDTKTAGTGTPAGETRPGDRVTTAAGRRDIEWPDSTRDPRSRDTPPEATATGTLLPGRPDHADPSNTLPATEEDLFAQDSVLTRLTDTARTEPAARIRAGDLPAQDPHVETITGVSTLTGKTAPIVERVSFAIDEYHADRFTDIRKNQRFDMGKWAYDLAAKSRGQVTGAQARLEARRRRPELWPTLDEFVERALRRRLAERDLAGPWEPLTPEEAQAATLSGRWVGKNYPGRLTTRSYTLPTALINQLRTTAVRVSEDPLRTLAELGLTYNSLSYSAEQRDVREELVARVFSPPRIVRQALERHGPWPRDAYPPSAEAPLPAADGRPGGDGARSPTPGCSINVDRTPRLPFADAPAGPDQPSRRGRLPGRLPAGKGYSDHALAPIFLRSLGGISASTSRIGSQRGTSGWSPGSSGLIRLM